MTFTQQWMRVYRFDDDIRERVAAVSWRQGPRKLDWRPRPVFSKARMVSRGAPVGAVLVCTRKGVNTAVETPERNRRKDHRCWWRGSISGRSRITLRWWTGPKR